MTRKDHVDGNAMMSAVNHQRRLIKLGETLQRVEPVLDRLYDEDVIIKGVTIRFCSEDNSEYFATIRAQVEGEQVVAFHAGATFYETVEGLINRLTNKSLRWKDDQYAK